MSATIYTYSFSFTVPDHDHLPDNAWPDEVAEHIRLLMADRLRQIHATYPTWFAIEPMSH